MADPYAAFSSPVANDPYAAFSSPAAPPPQAAQKPATTADKVIGSVPVRAAAGVADPLVGANALYDKVVGNTGQFITSGAGYFPNAVSDWFGQAANSGQTLANRETKAINDARTANGAKPGSVDWARMGGNVLSPANAMLAPEAGAGLGAKIASGLAIGASQPVDTNGQDNPGGDAYTKGVLLNSGVGAVTGGVLGSIGSKAKTPEQLRRAAQVKVLQNYGVQPSVGQQVGGNAGAVEEQLTSLPVVGGYVKNAQVARPIAELNRGIYKDVLSTLDDAVPADLSIGRPSVDYVNSAVNKGYNEVLPKMSLPIATAKEGIDSVLTDGSTLTAERQKQLTAWAQKFEAAKNSDGVIHGKELKGLTSDLRKTAFSLSSDQSADARDLGQSLFDLHDVVMDATKAANPETAPILANVDAAYAKSIRLNKAAGSVGATDGVFTPSQLNNAVLGSVSKRSAARASGNLPMQDISDAAQSILKSKVANSGTTDRGLLAAALLASPTLVAHPHLALGLAAGVPATGVAYSRAGQEALGNLLSGPTLADALRKYAPTAAPHITKAAAKAGPYVIRGATALTNQ